MPPKDLSVMLGRTSLKCTECLVKPWIKYVRRFESYCSKFFYLKNYLCKDFLIEEFIRLEVGKLYSGAKSNSLPVFVNKDLLGHSHAHALSIVYSCYHPTKTEVSSYKA